MWEKTQPATATHSKTCPLKEWMWGGVYVIVRWKSKKRKDPRPARLSSEQNIITTRQHLRITMMVLAWPFAFQHANTVLPQVRTSEVTDSHWMRWILFPATLAADARPPTGRQSLHRHGVHGVLQCTPAAAPLLAVLTATPP